MCVTAWGESKGMTRTVLRLTFGRDENIFFFRASVSKTRWGSWSFMSTSILFLAIQPPSLFSTHFGGVYERCFIGLEQSLVYIYSDSGNLDIGHKKPTTFVAKASTFVIHGINLSMASDCWLIFGIGHDNWQHTNRMPTRSSCSQANLVEFSSETYQCMWGDSSDYKPPPPACHIGKKAFGYISQHCFKLDMLHNMIVVVFIDFKEFRSMFNVWFGCESFLCARWVRGLLSIAALCEQFSMSIAGHARHITQRFPGQTSRDAGSVVLMFRIYAKFVIYQPEET